MLEFLTITSSLFDEVVNLPPSTLKGMARLRGKLKTLFGADDKTAVEARAPSSLRSK
jgi:hypothetical protein